MLTRREVVLLKLESTYNTDPVPTAGADALLVAAPSWSHQGARLLERAIVKSTLDTAQKIFGGTLMSVSFDLELKGSGAAGTAPEMGAALRACGLDETVVASTSVTYKPVSESIESATIYYYQDGKRKTLTGCRGTVSFNLTAGDYGKASFTFTGHVGSDTDQSLPTGTFDATLPEGLIGLSFVLGGYAAEINSLEFALNNEVSTPSSISSADGFGEIRIAGRDVAGSVDPEDELIATEDYIADWKADSTKALDTSVIGGTAGNRYQITMPAVAYRDIGPGDRDGIRTLDISFGAGISSGDDEFSLIFT